MYGHEKTPVPLLPEEKYKKGSGSSMRQIIHILEELYKSSRFWKFFGIKINIGRGREIQIRDFTKNGLYDNLY